MKNTPIQKNIKEVIAKIEKNNDVDVIYVSEYGSRLYGLNTESSDYDFKGIFLPSRKSMILGKRLDSIEYSTGNDKSKNKETDLDVSLMSLQKFMSLLQKGEAGAINLLFSMFREDTILIKKEVINEIKSRKDELITRNIDSFWGYATSQIKRFALKGDRYDEIKKANELLDEFQKKYKFNDSNKIKEFTKEFTEMFKNLKHFEVKELTNVRTGHNNETHTSVYIKVFGKYFEHSLSISRFITEMKRQEKSFGNRVKSTGTKIDKKGLSHSMRLAMECKELLTKGFITYPFEGEKKDIIMSIKLGLGDIEELKEKTLLVIDSLQEVQIESKLRDSISKEVVEDIILLAYKY